MAPLLLPDSPALLDGVRRSVRALREGAPGAGAGSWPVAAREEVVGGLDAVIQELTVYRGQVMLAHREAGQWGSVADRDYADYRSRTTGAGRGAAMGEVQLAEGLDQMPTLAGAIDRGDLGLEHAKTLTRLRKGASAEVRDAIDAGALDDLLEHATRDGLSAPELGKQARVWAARVDAQAAQDDFEAVRSRRTLTMRKHAGGIKGEFFLDPLAGDQLRTALDAVTGAPAAGEDRTREQRMADALTTIAHRTLQVGSDLTGAQVRPHISLIVHEQTWVGVLARRRTFETCPGGEGKRLPWPNVAPAELEDGTVIPLGELEGLMCDSELTRIVMNAAGIPLDVGRTQRTYTKELRRAILTRDRHCQWPGCRLRASWSEVHHITWFSRGGTTTLDGGLALCTYHHHRVHQYDIRITALPNGYDFHHPDGTHIGTTCRGSPPATRLPDPHPADSGPRHLPPGPDGSSSDGSGSDGPQQLSSGADVQTPPSLPPGTGPSRVTTPGNPHNTKAPPEPVPAEDRPPAEPEAPDALPAPRPAPVKVLGPPPPAKATGGLATSGTPLPSRPSTYATAPALWDSDPPF